MKLVYVILILVFTGMGMQLNAQSDSSSAKRPPQRKYGFRDSLYAAKLNYTGNLMIAGGVGLAGAGSFLIYEGVQTYNSPAAPASTNPSADIMRNHNQGTAYIIAGSVSFIGSAVLIALGAKNKVEFKRRKKLMSLQSGLLDSGNLGVALSF
jgi:hypothetical protein